MRRLDCRLHERGFTLIELLGVVLLLAVATTLAAEVFSAAMRGTQRAEKNMAALQTYDSILRQLRQDMWNAKTVEVKENGRVEIRQEGRLVVWSRDDDGALSRMVADTEGIRQVWRQPPEMAFAVAGTALEVTVVDREGKVAALLPSQVMMARRAR